ncbi:HNH endonuclease [Anatilimnocola floriformis]|uniref:HNH endonuclease n=1 Tax=Anatilimnocola floriformis TaxID=2948575 RepID=UPI0020C28931|nr:HNH endonuclease [Anatilimnocola floriformis]
MEPFEYPAAAHVRRHQPRGYLDVSSFLPWLRDGFCFRCVYCLRREQWDVVASLHIDHFLPVSQFPLQQLSYDNLLYACSRCNLIKGSLAVGNPTHHLLACNVAIAAHGELITADSECLRLIAQLRLNSSEMIHFRRLWLEIIAMARECNPQLHLQLMGFPADLPDLRLLKPPSGNGKPSGIEQSYLVQRERGELPSLY